MENLEEEIRIESYSNSTKRSVNDRARSISSINKKDSKPIGIDRETAQSSTSLVPLGALILLIDEQ